MSNKEDIKRRVTKSNIILYDRSASRYAAGSRTILDVNSRPRISAALEYALKLGGNNRLLDIGCGTGVVLDTSATLFDFKAGIDLSMGMLKVCLGRHRNLVRADCDLLPFAAETFNVISCYSVMHHLPEVEPLLQEGFRLLKPGGIFYSDYDPNLNTENSLAGRLYLSVCGVWRWAKKLLFPSTSSPVKPPPRPGNPEMEEVAKMAEYQHHYGEGFSPTTIRSSFAAAGFENIRIQTHDEFSSIGWCGEKKKKLKFFTLLLGGFFFQTRPDFLPHIMVLARKPIETGSKRFRKNFSCSAC